MSICSWVPTTKEKNLLLAWVLLIYIYIYINLCWSSTRLTNLAANFSYQSPRLKIKVARCKPASLSLLYIDAVKWQRNKIVLIFFLSKKKKKIVKLHYMIEVHHWIHLLYGNKQKLLPKPLLNMKNVLMST